MPTNPGSAEAKRLGCTCPVLDNAYGKGAVIDGHFDSSKFFTDPDCPIHRDARLVSADTNDAERGGAGDSNGDAPSSSNRGDNNLDSVSPPTSSEPTREGSNLAELPRSDENSGGVSRSGTETAQ